MGVRASGFDIHSTTDSRDGCWVAFHLCTHDRASPCTQAHSIPYMTFQENWGQLFVLLLLPLQQQYHNSLLIHVVGFSFQRVYSPLAPPLTCFESRSSRHAVWISAKLHTFTIRSKNWQQTGLCGSGSVQSSLCG